MSDHIVVNNNGPVLESTNYWGREMEAAGKCYLTINAGAFRLLLPRAMGGAVEEIRTADHVVVSRGPWPAQGQPDAIELLFDDGSKTPYMLTLSPEACDRLPADDDIGHTWAITVWVHPCIQALELPAYYRKVERLPYLRAWQQDHN